MRNTNISDLHPVMRVSAGRLISAVSQRADLPFRFFEGYRSPERQQQLFAAGGGVTRARGWQSAHQYGLAMDMVGWVGGTWSWNQELPWAEMREVARQCGLTTPLTWDLPHVEHPAWGDLRRVIPIKR